MEIDMKKGKTLRNKVDLSDWDLPQSIDFKVFDGLHTILEKVGKVIEQTAEKHLSFERLVKAAASEALTYAVKYDAFVDFCEYSDGKKVTICLPFGDQEFSYVKWAIDLQAELEGFARTHVYKAAKDEKFEKVYVSLIKCLRDSANLLEKLLENAKKNKVKEI